MPLTTRLLCVLLALALVPAALAQTGLVVPEMAHYDTYFRNFIQQYNIPGAAVAVSKDGRLVYARGFGLADVEAATPVEPDSRFRIASVSKPITGVAIMRLVEEGRLSLDAPAFAFLDHLPPRAGATEDARLSQITVRHLLLHAGGWDRDGTGYDPMFDAVNIASSMGAASPAGCETIIRYMRGRSLNFNPGARYAYSNFGYCVLGRIIEKVTGESYETYVQRLLREAEITEMELGRSLLADRLPGEVRYYNLPASTLARSVFDGTQVPWPYGGFHVEAMDAHGGWIASAVDLLRFSAALDGKPNRPDLLAPGSLTAMTDRPAMTTWNSTNWWYALGWLVNTNGHWWHNGSLPGAESILVRSSYQGLHWAVLLNARTPQSSTYMQALDQGMWTQAQAVRSWPAHDLFGQFVAVEATSELPAAPSMGMASPNPFRSSTTLTLRLPHAGPAMVAVFDALGRRVAVLHDGMVGAGRTDLSFDASGLAGGVYLVRADVAGTVVTQRVVLLR